MLSGEFPGALALPLSGTYRKPLVCKQSVYEFSAVLDPSSGKPFVLDDAAGHAKNAEDTESNIHAVSSTL
jgi:hypothetical protein